MTGQQAEPPVDADTRLAAVTRRIATAARAAHRDPAEITVVAVSKYHPLGAVRELAALGHLDFGESREQGLRARAEAEPTLRWHFIGRLQGNKARPVGSVAAMVHSLDRASLVRPLARGAERREHPLPVLVQLSLDGDPGRGGADPADLERLADLVAGEGSLRLAGLMAVAVPSGPPRAQFDRVAAWSAELRVAHPDARWISAGMSGDVEDAIAAGATHVRIGSAVFGPPDPGPG